MVLDGWDMLRGNWNLSGWALGADSFWPTEVPWYAAVIAVRGLTPAVMHEVPAVLYAALLAAACWVATLAVNSRARFVAIAVPVALFGFPSSQTNYPDNLQGFAFGSAGDHLGTILYVLISIALFAGWRARILTQFEARRAGTEPSVNLSGSRWWLPGWPQGVGAVLALAFAITGDPLAILIGIVPVSLEALIAWVRRGDVVRLLGLGYCGLAVAVTYGLQSMRGFTTSELGTRFVAWNQLGANLSLTVHGVLNLFGADFFGRDVRSAGTALVLVHLLGLGCVVWALARTLRRWAGGTADDWISTVLMLACLASVVEFAGSAFPAGLNTTRYLLPALVFGAALAGRTAAALVEGWDRFRIRTAALAIAGYSAAAVLSFLLIFSSPIAEPWPDGIPRLVEWLSANGLHNGWGVYRVSSIVTVESKGRITVRPVDGSLNEAGPSTYLWYSETPPEFVMWGTTAEVGSIDLRAVTDTFGPPKAVATVGQFQVATLTRRR